jgi:hypothetical protein
MFGGPMRKIAQLTFLFVLLPSAAVYAQTQPPSGIQSVENTASDGSKLACNVPLLLGTPGTRVISPQRPPSHISVMPTRYWDLTYTVAGARQIGVPLIAVEDHSFGPAGGLDDAGSFYLIPHLAQLFGLSVAQAIDLFYDLVIVLAFLAGSLGFILLFHSWLVRALLLFGLLALSALTYRIGDVYVFFFVAAAVAVPWGLVLIRTASGGVASAVGFVLLGAIIGLANAVRSHAGTAAFIFLAGILFFQLSARTQRKFLLLLCLVAGVLFPKLLFWRALAQRDAYLATRCPGYTSLSGQHVFWHSAYIGLGYLQNDYGIRWNDGVSYDKVQSIAPGTPFGSAEYERILRNQVLVLTRQHPVFVVMTLASKAGVLICAFLLCANVGLVAAVKYPKPWAIDLAFLAAIAFSSLFGLLVNPSPAYMLGLISFAALYGMVSLGFALEARSANGSTWQRIKLPKYHADSPVAVAGH